MKTPWQDIEIFDADGGHPDEETRRERLREYRDTGSIQGYFLDPANDADAWDRGPKPGDIDWAGIDLNP